MAERQAKHCSPQVERRGAPPSLKQQHGRRPEYPVHASGLSPGKAPMKRRILCTTTPPPHPDLDQHRGCLAISSTMPGRRCQGSRRAPPRDAGRRLLREDVAPDMVRATTRRFRVSFKANCYATIFCSPQGSIGDALATDVHSRWQVAGRGTQVVNLGRRQRGAAMVGQI